jgi:putative flippase GtrA
LNSGTTIESSLADESVRASARTAAGLGFAAFGGIALVVSVAAIYNARLAACRVRDNVPKTPGIVGPRRANMLCDAGMMSPRQLLDRLKKSWQDRAIVLKAITFGLVGVVNSAVDFGVFSFGYYYLMLPILGANLMSWCVAVTCSYVMNTMITFAAESGRKLRAKTFVNFLALQLLGLLANTATVLAASYFMPVLFGKLLAIGASFAVNFSLSHFVVFRRREPGAPI